MNDGAVDRVGLQARLPDGVRHGLGRKAGPIEIDHRVRERPVTLAENSEAYLAARARKRHRLDGVRPAHGLRDSHVGVAQRRVNFDDHMGRCVLAQRFATLLIHPRHHYFMRFAAGAEAVRLCNLEFAGDE